MAAGHFVTDRDFTFLSNIDPDELVDPRCHFIIVFPSEHFDVHDDTAGTVGNFQ